VKEWFAADELAGAIDGVSVAQSPRLRDEANMAEMAGDGLRATRFIARPDHHADLFDIRQQGLFDQDAENGFLFAVPVYQGLQRKQPLLFSRGRDDRLLDSHCDAPLTV
jgi:hypothetical protein